MSSARDQKWHNVSTPARRIIGLASQGSTVAAGFAAPNADVASALASSVKGLPSTLTATNVTEVQRRKPQRSFFFARCACSTFLQIRGRKNRARRHRRSRQCCVGCCDCSREDVMACREAAWARLSIAVFCSTFATLETKLQRLYRSWTSPFSSGSRRTPMRQ